jgi:DNA-binding NarL/FixJ family response regulator
MPLLNGLDAGEQVKELLPNVKIVYLTMNDDLDLAAEAFRRGASGYLLKNCAASELTTAVREVLGGNIFISAAIEKNKAYLLHQRKTTPDQAEKLTQRQREVLQLLAEGKAMKEAANALHLAPRTIAFHKYRIMKVLNARNNSDLVQYAIKHHLIAA